MLRDICGIFYIVPKWSFSTIFAPLNRNNFVTLRRSWTICVPDYAGRRALYDSCSNCVNRSINDRKIAILVNIVAVFCAFRHISAPHLSLSGLKGANVYDENTFVPITFASFNRTRWNLAQRLTVTSFIDIIDHPPSWISFAHNWRLICHL